MFVFYAVFGITTLYVYVECICCICILYLYAVDVCCRCMLYLYAVFSTLYL